MTPIQAFAILIAAIESGGNAMRTFGLITKIGPLSRAKLVKGSTSTIPFRTEVQLADGPALLELTPSAAAELLRDLEIHFRSRVQPPPPPSPR
jgi:hypothetical protein